ncbi:MAG: methionine synthase [Bacteroidaceae bacterium]|nr:methionine synthase [Bacteroidaceae bacterium]
MKTVSAIRRELQHRILVLDGAMGTVIQNISEATGQDFGKNNDMLPLTHPDVIRSIHRSYLEAGADIISTCSFGSQRISQEEFGQQENVREMALAAARLAREEADRMTDENPEKPRFVAGSVGPTGKMLSMSDNAEDAAARSITFDQLADAYEEQITALIEGGVDAILVETIFDTLNAKAAIFAAQKAMETVGRKVELMLSLTISDQSGRSLSGQTVEAFVTSIMHANPLTIGLNCGLGAEALLPYLRQLHEIVENISAESSSISDKESRASGNRIYISCHPNAGLPNAFGKYEDTPEVMLSQLQPYFSEHLLNIIGGCCGTTPAHIRLIAEATAIQIVSPSGIVTVPEASASGSPSFPLRLSGLEPFSPTTGSFTNIGERCNVAGSRKFLRLINEKNYDEAISIARKQVEKGAQIIDINMDDGLLDAREEMAHFVRLIAAEPDIARVPLMLDSSRFEVIEEALKWVQGKCIVNSISLKEGEEVFLSRAKTLRQFGAAVIVMAFDEEGQAVTYDRKISICKRAYDLLRNRLDFPAGDIIFDPNILTVATGMAEHLDYAYDFVRATEWIHDNLPGARVSGGLSNLSFAFRGNNFVREAMHTVFLKEAQKKGMDMAILNPATALPFDSIPVSLRLAIHSVLFTHRDEEATELLIALAEEIRQRKEAEKAASALAQSATVPEVSPSGSAPVSVASASEETPSLSSRLRTALVKGDDSTLKQDLTEALKEYGSALNIIEGPLMEGMNEVGKLFGDGKMFLPQVVKTARTMKQAVNILTSLDSLQASPESGIEKAPKYLLATVKGDVHDIGKNITGVVLSCNNFNVIDLGVMVPAEKIVETAIKEDVDFIALSGLITPSLEEMRHTAAELKKAGFCKPLFIGGATTSEMHTAVKIAPEYDGPVFWVHDASQNPVLATQLMGSERDHLIASLRFKQEQLRQENERKQTVIGDSSKMLAHKKVIDFNKTTVCPPSFIGESEVMDISTDTLIPYINWKAFYHLWSVKEDMPEANSLRSDAEDMLKHIAASHSVKAKVAFYQANGAENGIHINNNGEKTFIPTPRQQKLNANGEALSLCDFVAPEPLTDHIGIFAATISESFIKEIEELKSVGDQYKSLLAQSLADRLAEAASEHLHSDVRRRLWGYAPEENLSVKELFKAHYQGIRPAIGYRSLPDQKQLFTLAKLMDYDSLGITLTENGAMYPQSSVSGIYIANPESEYFII